MRSPARILATRLWWRYVFHLARVSTHSAFIERHERETAGEESFDLRTVRDWKRGRRYAQSTTVLSIDAWLPGAAPIYALAALLSDKDLTACAAQEAVSEYLVEDEKGELYWRLPRITDRKAPDAGMNSYALRDSTVLAQRGDFYGVLAILALLRMATRRRTMGDRVVHATNLYRALPAVMCLWWVKPDVDLFLRCVEDCLSNVLRYRISPRVNWEVFSARILAWQGALASGNSIPDFFTAGSSDNGDDLFLSILNAVERPVPLLAGVTPLPIALRPTPQEPPLRAILGHLRRGPFGLGLRLEKPEEPVPAPCDDDE